MIKKKNFWKHYWNKTLYDVPLHWSPSFLKPNLNYQLSSLDLFITEKKLSVQISYNFCTVVYWWKNAKMIEIIITWDRFVWQTKGDNYFYLVMIDLLFKWESRWNHEVMGSCRDCINDDMLSLYTRPITENSYPQILKTSDKPNIWPPWTDSMVFPFCCHIYIHPECINCCFTNRPVGEGSLAFAVISCF